MSRRSALGLEAILLILAVGWLTLTAAEGAPVSLEAGVFGALMSLVVLLVKELAHRARNEGKPSGLVLTEADLRRVEWQTELTSAVRELRGAVQGQTAAMVQAERDTEEYRAAGRLAMAEVASVRRNTILIMRQLKVEHPDV